MANRLDYHFRQRVTESELDRNLAADMGVYGIIAGAEPTPHSPVPDLTVDLTPPGRAYDRLGQRIFFGSGQRVNCSVDFAGIPTEVPLEGEERWLGIFLKFDRLLSDPRTDGNSQQVYFRRDESFQIIVRQAPPGPIGSASKVALQPDELLVCDVRREHGPRQILAEHIDTSRRQAFIFARAETVQVDTDEWTTLQPSVRTVQAALDEVDAEVTAHVQGMQRRHGAADIDMSPHGFVDATNVEGAIHELVDGLSVATAEQAGAQKIGAAAAAGTPHALSAGNVGGQISQLLAWLNNHEGAPARAHHASAIAAAPHDYVVGTSVQAQLQDLVSHLSAQSAGAAGASRVGAQPMTGGPYALAAGTVGSQLALLLAYLNEHANRQNESAHAASAILVADSEENLDASTVEEALAEIVDAFDGDHLRGTALGRPRRGRRREPTASLQRHRSRLVHAERRLGPRAVDPGLDLLLRFWVSPCSWGG
jgi:hypothetical protein